MIFLHRGSELHFWGEPTKISVLCLSIRASLLQRQTLPNTLLPASPPQPPAIALRCQPRSHSLLPRGCCRYGICL